VAICSQREPRAKRPERNATRLLCALLLISSFCLARSLDVNATCNCASEDLQIAFVLDCSGSMNHTLATLQEQIKRLVEVLEGQARTFSAAVIAFRTKEYVGKQKKIDVLPFTSDKRALSDFLREQVAEGGGEELTDEGIAAALQKLDWAQGARKVVVLLGDEQPSEERMELCIRYVRAMKERGIVFHAVTGSQTAWIYWAPANATSWKQQLMDLGDEAKRVFRLPYYDELARLGGGISVSSWNSRELILWLLAFGLGMNEQDAKARIDVTQFVEWSRQRTEEEQRLQTSSGERPSGVPLIAWVKHGGDWQPPRYWESLFAHLEQKLALSGPPQAKTLALSDGELDRFPVLYVTGHGPIRWTTEEKARLQDHLRNGGFLIADACCGSPEFSDSLRGILKDLFADRPLARLPPTHPLFSCGHRIAQVRASTEPRSNRLEPVDPELFGLELPDPATGRLRLAVVLSPKSLGCCWFTRPLSPFCQYHDADGLALTANILVWSLTR